MRRTGLLSLARVAGRFRLPANDVVWVAGAGLVAAGSGLVFLPAGLIVAGLLLLVVAVGGAR